MTMLPKTDDVIRLDYPAIEPRPETVSFAHIRYNDPFRWLEDDDDQVVEAWQSAQDALAQRYLEDLPTLATFSARLAAIGETDDIFAPLFAGGRWFKQHVPDGEDLAVIEVSDSPTSQGRRVVDLNAMRTGAPLQITSLVPSPDGRKALFAWTEGGHEEPHVRIIDIDSGATLVDGLPHRRHQYSAWLPDSSGILYFALDAALAGEPPLYRLSLETPSDVQPEPVATEHPVARPFLASDKRHIILSVDHLAPRPDHILDTQTDVGWRPFLKGVAGIFRGDILGDRFIAITDDEAPRGRLVSIPLATPTQRETWTEIVPASDTLLGTVVVTGGRAVLLDLVDHYARLRVFDDQGTCEGEIALPGRGVVNSFGSFIALFTMIDPIVASEDGRILFIFSTFDKAPALYSADLATRQVTQLTDPKHVLAIQARDLFGTSADGTAIPYHVVARADLDLSRPQPTVIHGYGGFNVSLLPGWLGTIWAAWIEAGGVVVLGHLRGGGEYGTPWWEQGRLENKQNSFNDVHAIAESLFANGLTTPEQLAVTGGSNGGVMASVVAVQRPELYRASVPIVPITDALSRLRDPVTMVSTLDYGDPTDPAMAETIYNWSPYQNIQDGVRYPAMLIDCGHNDPRCPPWHGRKFAARLQQASAGSSTTLLRVRTDTGHGSVGQAQTQRQAAERLAFLAHQLAVTV